MHHVIEQFDFNPPDEAPQRFLAYATNVFLRTPHRLAADAAPRLAGRRRDRTQHPCTDAAALTLSSWDDAMPSLILTDTVASLAELKEGPSGNFQRC